MDVIESRRGSRRVVGAAAIALAAAFNVPFSMLAAIYDYPDVLRRPAGQALDLFQAGGPTLVLVWYAFMLTALALTFLAPALAITRERLSRSPALAIGAAGAGALAGLAQAVGLSRWVFVVPGLARLHGDPTAAPSARIATEQTFDLLNAWGGVAIGEHLGQLLTAAFVLQVASMQRAETSPVSSALGFLTAALIFIGSGEGVAMALGGSGAPFGLITIAGFAGLTLWLVATGLGLVRPRKETI